MLLMKPSDIGIALQHPVLNEIELAIECQEAGTVLCGLRPSIHRAVIAVEHLYRRRPHDAEEIRRHRRDEMNLRPVALPCEIAEKPGDLARRIIAPAVLSDCLRREISGVSVLPCTILRRGTETPEGAALQLDFAALIGEAIFHLDVD